MVFYRKLQNPQDFLWKILKSLRFSTKNFNIIQIFDIKPFLLENLNIHQIVFRLILPQISIENLKNLNAY